MALKFMYFNFPFWRGHVPRLILKLGGIEFEDVNPGREEFMAMKSGGDLPYGQLPTIDVEGVRYGQSIAIIRYCGKLAGMYPSDPRQALHVDELMDVISELTYMLSPSFRESDEAKKLAMRKALLDGAFGSRLGDLDRRIGGATGKFATSDELTVADVLVWSATNWFKSGSLDGFPTTILDAYPNLAAHNATVGAVEGLA